MIASDYDGFTWRRGGAAYRRQGRDTYRGDPKVGRAMEANSANVTIKRLRPADRAADHAPIDNYINHGLLDAMKRCAREFGMQTSPVGDVIYARDIPKMEIVVAGLKGRNTVAINENRKVTFHLENVALPADVQVFVEGVRIRRKTLAQNQELSIPLTRKPRSILLRVKKGKLSAAKTIHLDYEPPSFNHILVSPNLNRENSFIVRAEGYRDDGYWNTSDFKLHVSLDGRRQTPRGGVSRNLNNLAPGRHELAVQLEDGAGRLSGSRRTTFTVGAALPTVEIIAPARNASVRRGSNLAISVKASDPEGIMSLYIYLDRISDDEFDPTRLCYFPGTFGADQPVTKTCRTPANWPRGSHKLIAIAMDLSGQKKTVEKTFRVE
jgi:hypothetical protein